MLKKYTLRLATSSLLALTLSGCAGTQQAANTAPPAVNAAQSGGLTQALTQQLGVSSQQASAGAGALFQVAQAQMGGNDFQQLTNSVPEIGGLINSATSSKPSGLSQIASGASTLIGDKSNMAGAAVQAYETFEKLGMSSDMVKQFVPVITDYVSKNAGPKITSSLISALTGL